MDRIEPIRPRPPVTEPIPAIRRTKRTGDERGEQEPPPRKKRDPAPRREPPPDDGRPHVDVTV
ncbi:MAG TPA: hypothetical protein VFT50_14850 [Baekduia sp.]|nr:hypothetical protein [Baekduia sp.]